MEQYNSSFGGLFEKRVEEEPGDGEPVGDGFTEYYGWIFNAKRVSDFEGIELDRVYDLPVTQFLNDLSYLKAEQNHNKKFYAGNTEQ